MLRDAGKEQKSYLAVWCAMRAIQTASEYRKLADQSERQAFASLGSERAFFIRQAARFRYLAVVSEKRLCPEAGKFTTKQVNVGRSLAADRRSKSKTVAKSG